MNRRRIRKYRTRRGNSGVKFLGITGIMIVAVICGYLTARFVIAPLLGYDTEVLKLDFPSKLVSVFGDGEETDTDKGEDSSGDKKDGNRKAEAVMLCSSDCSAQGSGQRNFVKILRAKVLTRRLKKSTINIRL